MHYVNLMLAMVLEWQIYKITEQIECSRSPKSKIREPRILRLRTQHRTLIDNFDFFGAHRESFIMIDNDNFPKSNIVFILPLVRTYEALNGKPWAE